MTYFFWSLIVGQPYICIGTQAIKDVNASAQEHESTSGWPCVEVGKFDTYIQLVDKD